MLSKRDIMARDEGYMTLEEELALIKGKRELVSAEDIHKWCLKHRDGPWAQRLEWDDAVAGHMHRLNQIRQILVTLEITYDTTRTRRFYSLSIDRNNKRGGGYRDISDILRNKSLYEILLADALNELARIEDQYEQLKELKPVWTAVEKIKGKKGGKQAERSKPV